MKMQEKTEVSKWQFLFFALYAFAAFTLEIVVLGIEVVVVGTSNFLEWSVWVSTFHSLMTSVLWGIAVFVIYKYSKKALQMDILASKDKIGIVNIAIAILLVAVYTVYVTALWNWRFKPLVEYTSFAKLYGSITWVKFIAQMIYYVLESALIYLVIVFAQEFGERVFKITKIPYGGAVLGLTWGLGHVLTKDFLTGIMGIVAGLAFGAIYLVCKKNPRYAFPLIALAFIL